MKLLVIDIGTTSMRGIVYNEKGVNLAMERKSGELIFSEQGWVSANPIDFWKRLILIVKELGKKVDLKEIEGISVTSQRSSIIPLDKSGKPLMDTIMWQDKRNKEICSELEENNTIVFKKTGARVNTVYSGSKMTWFRRNEPELYEKTAKIVNIPEYMFYLMTDEFHTDKTYGSRTGFMNLRKGEWDEELLRMYEVEQEKLCTLMDAGSIVGYTSERFEKESGIRAGIPVISAGGDQQCGALGQGVISEGTLSVVTGTGGYILGSVENVPDDLEENVTCNCSAVSGEYVLEANMITCSSAYDWAIRRFGGMEKPDYEIAERMLKKSEEVSSCLVIPYFMGKGAPDWDAGATAVMADVTLATTSEELLKSVVEGIFMELKNQLDAITGYVKPEIIYISGGMTKSDVINQIQADVYGMPVIRREDAESTAFGAFLTAAVTFGIYENVRMAWEKTKKEQFVKVYKPDMKKHEKYLMKQKRMNDIYESMKNIK